MANRSYLYSVNEIPAKGKIPSKIKGLSEFNYYIPFSYKLLLGGEMQKCYSMLWNKNKLGIIADYEKGVNHLKMFLDLLKSEDIINSEEFDKDCQDTLSFLNNPKSKNKYILLEANELFMMEDESPAKLLSNLYNEIKEISDSVDFINNIDSSDKKAVKVYNDTLKALKPWEKLWKENLGIDYWSDILYYNFSKSLG